MASSPTQVKYRPDRLLQAPATKTAVDHHETDVHPPSDHQLLEMMPDGVLVVDGDGRIVVATGRVEQMTGYTPNELRGHAI